MLAVGEGVGAGVGIDGVEVDGLATPGTVRWAESTEAEGVLDSGAVFGCCSWGLERRYSRKHFEHMFIVEGEPKKGQPFAQGCGEGEGLPCTWSSDMVNKQQRSGSLVSKEESGGVRVELWV